MAASIHSNCSVPVTLLTGRRAAEVALSFGAPRAFFLSGGFRGVGVSGEKLVELTAFIRKGVMLRKLIGPEGKCIARSHTQSKGSRTGLHLTSGLTPEPVVWMEK